MPRWDETRKPLPGEIPLRIKGRRSKRQESLWTKCWSDTFVTEEGKEELDRNILKRHSAVLRKPPSGYWGVSERLIQRPKYTWLLAANRLEAWPGVRPQNKRYFRLRLSITSPHKRFFERRAEQHCCRSFLS